MIRRWWDAKQKFKTKKKKNTHSSHHPKCGRKWDNYSRKQNQKKNCCLILPANVWLDAWTNARRLETIFHSVALSIGYLWKVGGVFFVARQCERNSSPRALEITLTNPADVKRPSLAGPPGRPDCWQYQRPRRYGANNIDCFYIEYFASEYDYAEFTRW